LIAVRAKNLGAKAVERRQYAAWSDFENRAIIDVDPAPLRCPIEVPVGTLDQRRVWSFAVRATALRTKVVKRRQGATWGDSEDRATALRAGASAPAIGRCSVEVPLLDCCGPQGARFAEQLSPCVWIYTFIARFRCEGLRVP
jgi:hypothetical protein